jgi:hypothetical protein
VNISEGGWLPLKPARLSIPLPSGGGSLPPGSELDAGASACVGVCVGAGLHTSSSGRAGYQTQYGGGADLGGGIHAGILFNHHEGASYSFECNFANERGGYFEIGTNADNSLFGGSGYEFGGEHGCNFMVTNSSNFQGNLDLIHMCTIKLTRQ